MKRRAAPAATRGASRATNTYFYGVVRWPLDEAIRRALKGGGVGDPPAAVRALRHRDVAALVSDVRPGQISDTTAVRGMRRDLRAHSAVLNRVTEHGTILPARYGTVLPDDAAVVGHVLAAQYRWLDERLAQLDGAVELSLKGTYLEAPVLEEVLRENPELARPRGARAGTGAPAAANYHARIDLGRRVVAAIQAKQAHDRRRLLESVGAHVREVRLREPTSELMVLNASVLLDRGKLGDFDRALQRAGAREANRVRLECVGPLPPFSFAELRL